VNQPSLFGAPADGRSARANIDGGSRGNPGPAGYGVHIEQDDGTIVELKESIGVATNNVAEYSGLLAALTWAIANGISDLHVRADSDLLVKQMRGEFNKDADRLANQAMDEAARPIP
jgi:probable phosphoglycerate mutase